MTIRGEIENLIKEAISSFAEATEDKSFTVEIPENKQYGDYATNVALVLAKKQGKNPIAMADEIRLKMENEMFGKIEVINGFINFHLKSEFIQNQVKEILKQGKKYGSSKTGKGKTIIIDYSAPNIAKKMHVGHLRSTVIGAAIYNIYKFLGYKVIGDNHLGDWGTQFGIMISAIKLFYPPYKGFEKDKKMQSLKNLTVFDMLSLYVDYNKKMEDPVNGLTDLPKEEFKKLEDGNEENKAIWGVLRKKSLEEFDKVYSILGIKFDEYKGESYYEPILKEIIKDCEKLPNERYFLSNGAYLINLDEFGIDPLLIKKSDGATLYATRELATIKERTKDNPDKIIYVVGNEQSLHFQQSFQAAELLGYISKNKLIHVKFGLILDENHKKLATRSGRFIGAEDLIKQIIELTEKTIKEKNPSLSEKVRKEAAKAVGIGALKYNDLSQNRQSDIVFDWDKMLSFDGNSAPYILYTYVRLQSILGKTKFVGSFKPEFLKESEELNVIKELIKFSDVVENSAESFQMNNLANYLYGLASVANNFYEKFNILKVDHDIRSARLALIKAVTIVLKNGLNLLGINTIEKM
jgi:arginyl-tRNA synthetase